MIELKRRTPSERQAYLEGYRAGVREGAKAVELICKTTAEVTDAMSMNVALMLALAAAEDAK
jgi:uncharacterized protein YnzC (UPF0291/DUF896 family)